MGEDDSRFGGHEHKMSSFHMPGPWSFPTGPCPWHGRSVLDKFLTFGAWLLWRRTWSTGITAFERGFNRITLAASLQGAKIEANCISRVSGWCPTWGKWGLLDRFSPGSAFCSFCLVFPAPTSCAFSAAYPKEP
jgi:hypothetical protein